MNYLRRLERKSWDSGLIRVTVFHVPKVHLLAYSGRLLDAELVARRQQEGTLGEKIGLADLGVGLLILPVARGSSTLLVQPQQRVIFRRGHVVFARGTAILSSLRHLLYRASKVGSAGSRSNVTRYARSTPRKTRSRRTVRQLRIDTLLLYGAQALRSLIVDRSACPRSRCDLRSGLVWKKEDVKTDDREIFSTI